MTKKKKRIILLVVFCALAYFVTRPMYYPGVGNNPNPREVSTRLLQQGGIISFGEMDRFLVVWSEFLDKDYDKKEMIKLLSSQNSISKIISSRAKRWIILQGWDVNRFFFVGRRLKEIVKVCRKKQMAQTNKESLLLQLNNTKDESIIATIKDTIEEQAQIGNNLTEQEIEMVMPHLDVISDILNGKLFYKPEY